MKHLVVALALVAGAMMPAERLAAHHGTGISYDLTAPLKTIKGVVTEFAWRNPHVSIFVDVADDNGNVTNWGIEHNNIATLAKDGYHRNTLKPGMPVTVVFHPSRAGAAVGLTVKVILADGKEILQRQQAGAPANN